MSSSRFAILGDFNIHWDKPSDSHVKRFMELIDSLNMIQHVQDPTHIDGHIIDLIFTRADNHGITSTRTSSLLSDHCWINSVVDMEKPSVPRKSIEYRKYRSIDKEAFRDDIAASELAAISPIVAVTGDATELFDKYNAVVSAIVDKHAPLQSGRVAVRPLVPWFSDALADAKRERRRMERKWRHTPIQINRDIYKTQCAHVKHMIKAAKSDFFVSELEQCKGDRGGGPTRRLYRLLNGLLQRGKSSSPPSNKDPQLLASRFAQAFNTKVETIRLTLGDQSVPCYSSDYQPCSSVPLLQTFPTTSVSDTCELIIKSPSTTCALDPVPTWLLKHS